MTHGAAEAVELNVPAGIRSHDRRGRIERWLERVWWQPSPQRAPWVLRSLAGVFGTVSKLARRMASPAAQLPVPVLVVGNLVVGGTGKTPIVIALVQALAAAGRRPGVISRGHGRQGEEIAVVSAMSKPLAVGDEPLLIKRRTGVPVFVGRKRARVAAALCAAHPEVDVIVSDDGLQHHALPRAAQVIVFDDRGLGNGLLLPAGPLREALPGQLPPDTFVVYTGQRVSTALPGVLVARDARSVVAFDSWRAGDGARSQPLSELRGRRLTALAGIGAPEQFFAALEAAGLSIMRLACSDHAEYTRVPWPAGSREIITTEKDAVKLATLPPFDTPVWVLPLDCHLPPALLNELLGALGPAKKRQR